MTATSDQKNEIISSLEPLFREANKTGKWFFSPYQAMWFSPRELRDAHARGRFVWGPVNWQLRDPRELLTDAEKSLKDAEVRLERTKARLRAEGVL